MTQAGKINHVMNLPTTPELNLNLIKQYSINGIGQNSKQIILSLLARSLLAGRPNL